MKITTLLFVSLAVIAILSALFYFYISKSNIHVLPVVETKAPDRTRRIVAFGDSVTYGYGLESISDSYPSQLQVKLKDEGYNYVVINVGVSGDTTEQGLARLSEALSFEPDLVLLEFGANDALQSKDPVVAQQNLEKMIQAFQDKRVQVILLNIEPSELITVQNSDRYAQIMPALAKKYGLSLVPSFLHGILLTQEYTLADRIHPNKVGYTKAINDNLWPILTTRLVKSK